MTVSQAAVLLKRSESTVQRLCQKRVLRAVKSWRKVSRTSTSAWRHNTVLVKWILDARSVRAYARRQQWS